MGRNSYKTSQIHLENIVEHCRKIRHYSKGLTEERLADRDIEFDAIVQRFQAIGENVVKIDSGQDFIIDNFPEAVDWRGLKRLRDVISHNYEGLVASEIFKFIQQYLDDVEEGVIRILRQRYGKEI